MLPTPRRASTHAFLTAALGCAVLWFGIAVAAQAAVLRIDETGTVVNEPVVNMKWRHLVPGRAYDNTVEATLRVDVRLNLAPWINKPARIYMVLAPVTGDRIHARWTSQGRLLPGSVYSGERALVYEGVAGPANLSESLLLTVEADGQRLTQQQTLNFHFEIEVAP